MYIFSLEVFIVARFRLLFRLQIRPFFRKPRLENRPAVDVLLGQEIVHLRLILGNRRDRPFGVTH